MEQHLVQKYIFDVGFDSENKAKQFQNQLTPYVKEKLLSLTEEVFNEESEGKNISIEKLGIDLGNISLDNFEEEMYTQLKSKLRDKLRLLLSGIYEGSAKEEIKYTSPVDSDLEIVKIFLETGILPWSAPKNNPDFSIQKLISRLIEENPSD